MPRLPKRLLRLAWPLILAAGCSAARYTSERGPELAFPAHIFERRAADAGPGDAGGPPASVTDAASGRSRPHRSRPTGSQPDPEPLRLTRQWQYTMLYDRAKVTVARVKELHFRRPVVTARNMGRYAIELWIGHELVDRVRFDFPLVAAAKLRHGPRRPLHELPTLAAGAVVTRQVLIPASPRATRAVLVDRATGTHQRLPWPPDHPLPPPGVPVHRAGSPAPGSDAGQPPPGHGRPALSDAGAD